MKKLLLLLFCSFLLTFSSNATHMVGGEITWKCDGPSNNQYRFFMTVYRDCGGYTAGFGFNNQTIDIVGGSLPRNAFGQPINSIIMKPDSTRWLSENNGEIALPCNLQGTGFSCANRDQGTLQAFYFTSDPITLSGIPPNRGWTFYWQSPCCRPGNMLNGQTAARGKSMLLRAIMFPTKNRENVNPCIDHSPQFISSPASAVCRGNKVRLNQSVTDLDLDSISFSWSYALNLPQNDPDTLGYAPGYAYNNPTPDQSFNILNIPSSLNPISGIHELGIFSGAGTEKFLIVYRADSWREGTKIASVFREFPIIVIDCPISPIVTFNSTPQTFINGLPKTDTVITVFAGEEIRLPLQFIDADSQFIKVVPEGLLFSPDRSSNSLLNCSISKYGSNDTITSCAYLQQQAPIFDSTLNKYVFEGLSIVSTEFVWKTDCSLISNKFNNNGSDESIFNFIFRVSDDHCPLPAVNYLTITLKVKDTPPLDAPIMRGASVGLDGNITYQWVPPVDSANSFDRYKVQATTQLNGDPPRFGATYIENDLRVYANSAQTAYAVYLPIGGNPANGPNILRKIPGRDWYFRMNTVSGCKAEGESNFSEPLQVIELDAKPSSIDRTTIILNWNNSKPLQFNSSSQFFYKSFTRYYIWQCDSIESVDISDESNWFLRGTTTVNTFQMPASVCVVKSAYRVEERDFVVTYAQGSGKFKPQYDTLYYSTFSIIDSLHTYSAKPTIINLLSNQLKTTSYGDSYQWLNCQTGQLLAGENRNFFNPISVGSYAVIVSQSGCRDTSDCIPFFPVGLEKQTFQNSLKAYPNPTSSQLNIELAKLQSSLQLKVFTIHGQLVMNRHYVNQNHLRLDLEGDAGIYFIQLTNQNGEQANLKVVKQ